MLIGGAQIYRRALELGWVSKIILTRVMAEVEGDTFLELRFKPPEPIQNGAKRENGLRDLCDQAATKKTSTT